jgi:serine/threonine-protein kinase HipA
MMKIEKLKVSVNFDGQEIEVGEIVISDSKIYFRYNLDFIIKKIELSPFKLPLSDKIYSTGNYPFDGLFGLFNDSLPDGWGKLLLDRALISKGISLYEVTPLDRLAYVGSRGMGALIYKPEFDLVKNDEKLMELDFIANQAQHILEGTSLEILEELYRLGGSSGGARPKILIGYNPHNNQLLHGANDLPDGFEHWVIKFPSTTDLPDIANIEYAYYKMASDSGIKMNPCKLFSGNSGKNYFGTKRFDRQNDQRIHMHSASGLLHDNYRMSTMDYGHLMDCAFRLEKHVAAYEKVFRLAAFNVYANNCDDHSKNFAFLMDSYGKWELSPAYDLTFSYAFNGMHSTMVAGESRVPGMKQLLELALNFGVKNPDAIIEGVKDVISLWNKYADENGVTTSSRNQISKVLNQNLKR